LFSANNNNNTKKVTKISNNSLFATFLFLYLFSLEKLAAKVMDNI